VGGARCPSRLLHAPALITLALVVHRRPPNTIDSPTAHERSKARTHALLERLSRLRVLTTIVAGFLLGIGGPKRLVLTCLAATTIVTAGFGDAGEAALVVVYVILATALVWGPLILFLLLGKRVIAFMEGAEGEVGRRQPQVTVYALLILAGLLVLDAGSFLLT
jgi:Sap, sulfolipid-1-addressing protein